MKDNENQHIFTQMLIKDNDGQKKDDEKRKEKQKKLIIIMNLIIEKIKIYLIFQKIILLKMMKIRGMIFQAILI